MKDNPYKPTIAVVETITEETTDPRAASLNIMTKWEKDRWKI